MVLGIAVGGATGLVLEAGDNSIHDVRQLQNAIRIPVLAAIPRILLESDRRILRRHRIRMGFATAAMVTFALVGGAASYVWVNGGLEWSGEEAAEEPAARAPAEASEG